MLVFRRAIGREGCVILRKCDDHEAGAAGALYDFAAARTDHEMATILPERDLVRRQIVLVAIGIGHIDLGQPISLCHRASPRCVDGLRACGCARVDALLWEERWGGNLGLRPTDP